MYIYSYTCILLIISKDVCLPTSIILLLSILQVVSDSEEEEESMDADQPETFVAHVPVPSQEEVSKYMYVK